MLRRRRGLSDRQRRLVLLYGFGYRYPSLSELRLRGLERFGERHMLQGLTTSLAHFPPYRRPRTT